MRSSVSSRGCSSFSIASDTAAGVDIAASMLKPAHAREQQCGGAGQRDEGEAARAEGDADPEERGQRADLQLAERREPDGDHPGAARTAAEVRGRAELEQALREQVGERPHRVDDDEHGDDAREADDVRRQREDDQARAEREDDADEERPAPAPRGGRREAHDAADGARRVERAEALGPRAQDVARQAREEHLVREAQHLRPAVMSMSTKSVRSLRVAAAKSTTPCQSEPDGGGAGRSPLDATSSGSAPARKPGPPPGKPPPNPSPARTPPPPSNPPTRPPPRPPPTPPSPAPAAPPPTPPRGYP